MKGGLITGGEENEGGTGGTGSPSPLASLEARPPHLLPKPLGRSGFFSPAAPVAA